MKPGAGKEKGSAFEREVCKRLSLWLSKGEQPDMFTRNVLSGGRFTNAEKRGKILGIPGDIAAAHPEAYAFMQRFSVECKHHKDLMLQQYITGSDTSSLAKIIKKAQDQAESVSLHWMLIAKQNLREPLLFVSSPIGGYLKLMTRPPFALRWHSLHRGSIFLVPFHDMLKSVDAQEFMATIKPLRTR